VNNLNFVLGLFGGMSNLIVNFVNIVTKGKINLTVEGVGTAADRALTISQRDIEKACAKLKVTDPADVAEAVALFREAGDKLGDAVAFLAAKSAHLE